MSEAPRAELSIAEQWASLDSEARRALLATLPEKMLPELLYDWDIWARPDQKLPPGNWFCWSLLSGRGAGKTRTGAETIRKWVGGPNDPPIRIALVAQSAPDSRDVMVEGDSGIMAVSPPWNRPIYQPSKRRLVWPNGSVATTFSGDKPDQLRGPQFHKAWVDEIAKFQYPQDVWDNLELGLRLGARPQAIVTTTPRPIPLIREMVRDPLTIVTRVSTYANIANLASTFISRVVKKYEGTRLGRQELNAEILMDVQGALWTYEMLENARMKAGEDVPKMNRIVIGLDPATTDKKEINKNDQSNETGISVCGRGVDGKGYTLVDASGQFSPDQWAQTAITLYKEWGASRIVAESNQGGEMVRRVIHSRDPDIPVRLVTATKSKGARAEPVAALYEQNKIRQVGMFAGLEDQMVLMTPDHYLGQGSPDRLDAMVWAYSDLFFGAHTSSDIADYASYHR